MSDKVILKELAEERAKVIKAYGPDKFKELLVNASFEEAVAKAAAFTEHNLFDYTLVNTREWARTHATVKELRDKCSSMEMAVRGSDHYKYSLQELLARCNRQSVEIRMLKAGEIPEDTTSLSKGISNELSNEEV